jgi:hypothetical protein
METYLVIKDNKIVNAVIWDDATEWLWDGEPTLASDLPENVWIGWELIDGVWVDMNPVPEPVEL